jgi:hypothetical protein
MQAYSFKLKMADRTITTYVYSDTGKDIESRFPNYGVSDIKKLDKDPTVATVEEKINEN